MFKLLLVLVLAIGAVQMSLGLILGILDRLREGERKHAMEKVGWLMVIAGIALALIFTWGVKVQAGLLAGVILAVIGIVLGILRRGSRRRHRGGSHLRQHPQLRPTLRYRARFGNHGQCSQSAGSEVQRMVHPYRYHRSGLAAYSKHSPGRAQPVHSVLATQYGRDLRQILSGIGRGI